MENVSLSASMRPSASRANALRQTGKVPCVFYGNKEPNTQITCEYNELLKAYAKAGESTLVQLSVDGRQIPVLFHSIDHDPVSERIRHVDFYVVDMTKEIEARVPIRLVGESPAVKDSGAILVTARDHVTVRCLPANLPHAVEASLTTLMAFGDSLTVASLIVPEGVQVAEASDVVIAIVQEPRSEEEIAPTPATPAEGEAAVTAEGATAEGAAPAEGDKAADKKDDKK